MFWASIWVRNRLDFVFTGLTKVEEIAAKEPEVEAFLLLSLVVESGSSISRTLAPPAFISKRSLNSFSAFKACSSVECEWDGSEHREIFCCTADRDKSKASAKASFEMFSSLTAM